MKTLGRILIILVVFAALSGLMIVSVNTSGSSASNFRGEGGEFRPAGDQEGFPPLGFRPEGFDEHGERGERRGGGISGLMFGAIKNTLVIGLLVVAIVLPKNVIRKNKKTVH